MYNALSFKLLHLEPEVLTHSVMKCILYCNIMRFTVKRYCTVYKPILKVCNDIV